MKRMVVVLMAMALLATAAFAGNKKKTGGVDLSTLRTVTGSVTAVAMDYGLGHPGFTMDSAQEGPLTVNLGPYFYLVANNFSLAVGDQVSASVATCATGVVAFEVTDLTTGKQILLRDAGGFPLWTGGKKGGGQGAGQGNGHGRNGCRSGGYGAGQGVDLSTLIEVQGPVTAVNSGVGTHNNTLTLQAGPEAYTVSLGPLWYMTGQGFAFQAGETLRVRMALCQGHWAAFSVTRASTGEALQLRDDQGVPLWLD